MRALKAVSILVTFTFLLSQPPSFTQEQSEPPQTSPQQQNKVEPLRLGGPDSPLILVDLVPFDGMRYDGITDAVTYALPDYKNLLRNQRMNRRNPALNGGIVFGILSRIQGVWLVKADIFNESQ